MQTLKKLVFYGAFDRYNYGDNLMPILLEMALRKRYGNRLSEFDVDYCAVTESNLEKVDCRKTTRIKDIIGKLPAGSAVVSVGGEIVGSPNDLLFIHSLTNLSHIWCATGARRLIPSLYRIFVNRTFSPGWEIPYLTPRGAVGNRVKIVYNTVGGDIPPNGSTPQRLRNKPSPWEPRATTRAELITERLRSADYVSVRDERTLSSFGSYGIRAHLFPDSVSVLPDLINDEFLLASTRSRQLPSAYFVFQCAPRKIGATTKQVASEIRDFSKASGLSPVLLPIGYAGGHDDVRYLNQVKNYLDSHTVLLHDLSLFEIMATIKHSQCFLGTSLHGVITAMAFAVPYFGLNPEVTKLNSYLRTWGIGPSQGCISHREMPHLVPRLSSFSAEELRRSSENLAELAWENIHRISEVIFGGQYNAAGPSFERDLGDTHR